MPNVSTCIKPSSDRTSESDRFLIGWVGPISLEHEVFEETLLDDEAVDETNCKFERFLGKVIELIGMAGGLGLAGKEESQFVTSIRELPRRMREVLNNKQK